MSVPDLHVVVLTRAIAPVHGFGGLERAAMEHVRHLARLGTRITVVTQDFDPGLLPADLRPPRVNWMTHPFRPMTTRLRPNSIADRLLHYGEFTRGIARDAVTLARREHVDIVHAHGLAGTGYARLVARGDSCPPLVLNPHGLEEFSRQHPVKFLAYAPFRHGLRRAASAARAVIATDRALAATLPALLRVTPERVVNIPNGVDLAAIGALVDRDYAELLTEQLELTDADPLLVSVARLEKNKGLDLALRALVLAGWPARARWLIVGRGTEHARLDLAIGAAGLRERVRLAGALADRDLHNVMSRADLGLVPSRYEGSSLAALELMAHALPVVATLAGGLPDKVIPDVTGYTAVPGSVPALAAALATAFTDRARWPILGGAGRELVARQFDWPRLAQEYIELYRGLG